MGTTGRLIAALALVSLAPAPAPVVSFTDVTGGDLTNLVVSRLALGDTDNDGDLDLGVEGWTPGVNQRFMRIYKNTAGTYTHESAADFGPGFNEGPVAFGDGDNDGRLEVVFGGWSGGGTFQRLFRNEGGGAFFFLVNGLRGMKGADAAWADIDNDGDLDLILIGESLDTGMADFSQVYRNDGNGRFVMIQDLTGAFQGQVAAGDYDADGDLDLAITGRTVGSRIFKNTNGVFVDAAAGLPSLLRSAVAWADIDNDGDLDLALCGGNGTFATHFDLYRNDGGTFVALGAGLPAVHAGDLRWGDFDNDGDPDLAVTGLDAGDAPIVRIYTNTSSVFADSGLGLVAMANAGTSAWGDYDNDGDLDLFVAGHDLVGQSIKIYRNDGAPANPPPTVPGTATAAVSGADVTFSWGASTDTPTPAAALTYNLRVGTTPGGEQIMAAMADLSTGARRIAAAGNVQHNLSWKLKNLPVGTYYYSVQAIDGAFQPSGWTTEGSIAVPAPAAARVVSMMPGPGTKVVAPTSVLITLDGPADPASVNEATVALFRPGPDGTFGTVDDVRITPTGVAVAGNQIVLNLTGLTLKKGRYRVVVSGTTPSIAGTANWWKLDDGPLSATAADGAGSLTGTLGGGGGTAPTWENGRMGSGLRFWTGDARVALGGADLSVPWTAAMWVNRADSSAPESRILDGASSSLRLEEFDGTSTVGVTSSSGANSPFGYQAPPGIWVHLTLVGEASGTSLYVNGVFSQKLASVLPCPRGALGSLGVNAMKGVLDDVRLFDRVLTPLEIKAVAALGGAIRDSKGSLLDGEFSGTFPSGQGAPGGDFAAVFTIKKAGGGGGSSGCGLFGPELLGPWALLRVLLRKRRTRGS